MLLNTAQKIYVGTNLAKKVYKGTVKVWGTDWTPEVIPGLAAWVDASQITATEGQRINSLTELSSAHRVFTAPSSNGPVYTVLNGKPRLRFDGAQELYTNNYNPGTVGISYAMCFRYLGPTSYPMIWTYNGNARSYEWRTESLYRANLVMDYATGGPVLISTNSFTEGVDAVGVVIVKAGGQGYSRLWVNGTNWIDGASSNAMPNVASNLSIASRLPDGYYANIAVSEGMVYSGILTDVDRVALENYLKTKWGVV